MLMQISFFILNAHIQWNDTTNTDKPTNSNQMARLFKNVERMYVQCHGMPSKVHKPEEYEGDGTHLSS
jgi:hypothetical protein